MTAPVIAVLDDDLSFVSLIHEMTQVEDLFADLHEHLILERLGQGVLTDTLGPIALPRDDAGPDRNQSSGVGR